MSQRNQPRWLVAAVAICMVVSGVSGLVYEVVWARLLGIFLGASAHAHAIVSAGFLGGLALGNSLFGRLVDRRPGQALAIYALLEVFIGVYGLVSPETRLLVGNIYNGLIGSADPGSLTLGAKLLAAGAFVLLPATAMGGTLPALTRYVVQRLEDVGATVARLYFLNTVGAAMGAFAAGFILIPRFGAALSVRGAGVLNLIVAAAATAAYMSTRTPTLQEQDEDAAAPSSDATAATASSRVDATPTPSALRPRLLLATALVMGWASLTMEVAWVRVFSMVYGSSAQAFTLMLTAFIGGIALGSLLVPWALRRFVGREPILLAGLLAIAAAVLVVQLPFYERLPFWQFKIAHALERRPHVYPIYLSVQAAMAFAWMLPLTIVTGASLPVAAHAYTRRLDSVGGNVGALFSANTLGNVVGPMTATFLLFPMLGLRHTVTAGIAALGLASVLAAASSGRAQGTRLFAAMAGFATLLAIVLPVWNGGIMHSGGFRRWTLDATATFDEFVESRARSTELWASDGAADSVIVLENRDGLRFMKVNGKTDASDAEDLPTQRMVAHIPLLMHRAWTGPGPRDVFVVGLGSGVTVGSAAMHEDVSVTAAEISQGVIEASHWFDHVNRDVHHLPNVALHTADAREWLERSDQRWDVVINQPSNPWIAGNAALFSREFFVAARERLAEQGVFAQWMHVYAMDDATVEIVMNTFASVFPHVTIWWPQGVDLVLLGSMQPLEPDLQELGRALEWPALQEELAEYDREGLRPNTVERFLAMQIASDAGFHHAFDGSEPHTTDLRPTLEYRAPVAQFVGARSELFVEVDERLRPGDWTGLYWNTLFGGGELPGDVSEDLLEFFATRDTPFSQRLAGSLQHAATDGPLDALTPSDMSAITTRATGLPVLLEQWGNALLRTKSVTPQECRTFLEMAQPTLSARASAFYRPPMHQVDAVVAHCVEEQSATVAGFIVAMQAEIYDGCGYHSAAVALAQRLLDAHPADAVVQAMQALVDRRTARP